MVKLRFLPVRRLGFALRCMMGAEEKSDTKRRNSTSVSPFAALTVELAATIGTGNIVGVATAVTLGGPGALFWMMVAGILGLATKLTESALAVKYRCKNARGEWTGGPMFTIKRGIPGKFGGFLAACYALFAVLASFGMGNMTQSNSIAQACKTAYGIPPLWSGMAAAFLIAVTVISGISGIVKLTQILVPFMGVFYMLGICGILVRHPQGLVEGLAAVLVMAFAPKAVAGGMCGQFAVYASLSAAQALRMGVSRGVFSNEAGLGAGGITAASADTEDYIRQGYISMTGVFFDTMIICFFTGLAFVASGYLGSVAPSGERLDGAALVMAVFTGRFGERGAGFVAVSMVCFAFATIVAWAYQGEKAFAFLLRTERYNGGYRMMYVLFVLLGAICPMESVWIFSDICNGLMAVPNLISVLLLGLGTDGICEEIRAYH